MTGAKEVEQSSQDKPESVNNDPVAMKEIEMEEKKPGDDKEEVDEEEVEVEAEGEAEEEEEEEEDEDDDEDEETEESENEDDEQEKKLQTTVVDVSDDRRKELHVESSREKSSEENANLPADEAEIDGDPDVPLASLKSGLVSTQKSPVIDEKRSVRPDTNEDNGVQLDVSNSLNHQSLGDVTISRTDAGASINAQSPATKGEHMKEEELKDDSKLEEGPTSAESRRLFMFDTDTSGGGESGTEKEQAAFIMELHKFYKGRGVDFKPPKFYQEPLNLLKLWRAVLKLGGYDKVTNCKYWRQIGESFRPPRTCTTVSWTFRIFYEKALLDYERFRTSPDGSGLPASLSIPMSADNQAPGSGRARRDAAARAMQGWHSQRVLDNGEVSDPVIKDKNSLPVSKKEKPLKSLGGILKRKKTSSTDDAVKSAQMKLPKIHSDATVIDIGSPADWVKINVRATRDCYEVYALVPGLLREEVRVQSDPAGRLVISGEPENPDNPWNVTPFKKVVSLPSRIDPHQTSAVVTLHGQLFVRVPFEQFD